MKPRIILFILSLVAILPGATAPVVGGTVETTHNLIDFGSGDRSEWSVVNDGVMGGVSRSGLRLTDHETGIFAGVLSLENNGGFASVRAAVGHRDLSAWAGLEIRVRGDGRTYQLRLRTNDRFDGVAYRAFFETSADEWTTVRLPFARFEPTFRGRTPRDAGPLDPAAVHQVGFMLADKQPGAFSLEIDFVRTWVEE
jgi:monofunctional biosynthetic peptidoglycan transglycosylase